MPLDGACDLLYYLAQYLLHSDIMEIFLSQSPAYFHAHCQYPVKEITKTVTFQRSSPERKRG